MEDSTGHLGHEHYSTLETVKVTHQLEAHLVNLLQVEGRVDLREPGLKIVVEIFHLQWPVGIHTPGCRGLVTLAYLVFENIGSAKKQRSIYRSENQISLT
jgi:hypothetical protein